MRFSFSRVLLLVPEARSPLTNRGRLRCLMTDAPGTRVWVRSGLTFHRPGHKREHTLPDGVRLLEVRVAGEDELFEPELVVLEETLRHLLVAADQGRPRPGTHQPDARP